MTAERLTELSCYYKKARGIPRIILISPIDAHSHLRGGQMLNWVIGHTVRQFAAAVIMPNDPEITNVDEMIEYRDAILRAAERYQVDFLPLMTMALTDNTTTTDIYNTYQRGAIAFKLYFKGTTHSKIGITDLKKKYDLLRVIRDCGGVLSGHWELPDAPWLKAEDECLSIFEEIANGFPDMRIIFEHVSTAKAANLIESMPANIAATITPQHLIRTHDEVFHCKEDRFGDQWALARVHDFFKPIAKTAEDREVLREKALSGSSKFFLGTDTAPHRLSSKLKIQPSPGAYSAPMALPFITEFFDEHKAYDELVRFVCTNAAAFYDVTPPKRVIQMKNTNYTVPKSKGDGPVPFLAGESFNWRVESWK